MKRVFKFSPRAGVGRWHLRLKFFLERPSYVPLTALTSAVNLFFPFLPIELFLVLRVLARPWEWWRNALLAAAASALGAACLAQIAAHPYGASLAEWLMQRVTGASWERVSHFIRMRGATGVGLVAFSFLPLPPAVLLCAWSKVPATEIAFSVGIGNGLKYGLFSWCAARFPRWFRDGASNVPAEAT